MFIILQIIMNELTSEEQIEYMCNSSALFFSPALKKIITTNKISYTQNNNGIFLNLSLLDETLINELYSLFIIQNNDTINFIDKIDDIIISNNINIKININKTPSKAVKKIKEIKLNKLDSLILKTLNGNLNLI